MTEWHKKREGTDTVWQIGFANHIRDLREGKYVHSATTHHDDWSLTATGNSLHGELLGSVRTAVEAELPLGLITDDFVQDLLCQETSGPPEGGHDEHLKGHRSSYSQREGEWHKRTKRRIAEDPSLLQLGISIQNVTRIWLDQLESGGVRLWNARWVQKRPDVVFALGDSRLVVVEVEPIRTIRYGASQIIGDYLVEFQVDRLRVVGEDATLGVLVTDSAVDGIEAPLLAFLRKAGIRVVQLP